MLSYARHLCILVSLCSFGQMALCQNLDFLPPVLAATANKDTGTSFILSTSDMAPYRNKTEAKPYTNSIQIVDADQPWPPRWYTATLVCTDEVRAAYRKEGRTPFNFLVDPQVSAGHFQLYKLQSYPRNNTSPLVAPDQANYLLLNERMEAVDTVKSNIAKRNLYYHNLAINKQNERLVNIRKDTYLDLRDYTLNDKDSCVHGHVDYIQILSPTGKLIYSWNPIEFIDPKLFRFDALSKDPGLMSNNDNTIEWTRLTSTLWDYDGEILYSMKNIGIGKFSRRCKELIWKIDCTDIPIISGKDTLEWYCPHDLNLLSHTDSTATYSLFSDGQRTPFKPAYGVVFEMGKYTHVPKLIKYVRPQHTYFSTGQGSLDYKPNGNYVMAYGSFPETDEEPNLRGAFEYGNSQHTLCTYQLPKWIYVYKARQLENWPRPPRPVIVKKDGMLEATGPMTEWTWYKLEGDNYTSITKVGTGSTFQPKKGNVYCVEGKYGIGYSVSRPFKF